MKLVTAFTRADGIRAHCIDYNETKMPRIIICAQHIAYDDVLEKRSIREYPLRDGDVRIMVNRRIGEQMELYYEYAEEHNLHMAVVLKASRDRTLGDVLLHYVDRFWIMDTVELEGSTHYFTTTEMPYIKIPDGQGTLADGSSTVHLLNSRKYQHINVEADPDTYKSDAEHYTKITEMWYSGLVAYTGRPALWMPGSGVFSQTHIVDVPTGLLEFYKRKGRVTQRVLEYLERTDITFDSPEYRLFWEML